MLKKIGYCYGCGCILLESEDLGKQCVSCLEVYCYECITPRNLCRWCAEEIGDG